MKTKILSALIVEDEVAASDILVKELNNLNNKINVIGVAQGVNQALKYIKLQLPDIVFLDIELKDGLGFELAKKIIHLPIHIIFTTAFDKYAIEAFRINAIDYLLKPILSKNLDVSINRVLKQKEFSNAQKNLDNLINTIDNNGIAKKLAVKEASSIVYIDIENVIQLKADGNYTTIILINGRQIVSSKVLKYYSDMLEKYGFYRIHRSNMINLNYVKEFKHQYGGSVVLTNNEEISVSPEKKKEFLNLIGLL